MEVRARASRQHERHLRKRTAIENRAEIEAVFVKRLRLEPQAASDLSTLENDAFVRALRRVRRAAELGKDTKRALAGR